jgi:hypothetical protein
VTVEFITEWRNHRNLVMIIELVLLLLPYMLGNVQGLGYLHMQKMPEPKVLQINNGNIEFNNHVGIDWLVAILAITGSILTLVVSDRIVYKLRNKKIDWHNEFK